MTKAQQVYRSAMVLMLFCLLGTGTAWAKSPILKNWRGWAVKGYDVVAYFNEGRPVKGVKAHQHIWRDAAWRFSSAENLAAFKADPAAYAPQYGGY